MIKRIKDYDYGNIHKWKWFASSLTTKNNSKRLGIFREKLFLWIKLDLEVELQN